MPRYIGELCEFLMTIWSEATLSNYATLALAIVVIGWFVRQYEKA